MNNENKDFLINDAEEANIGEEDIILAPPTELYDEAKEIARTTTAEEKYPFTLQYNSNQKDFLKSMLQMVGAAVETDDDEGHMFETRMNMMQLAFIKRLDCVERVKTDEGINPFLAEEAEKPVSNQQKPRKDEASAEFSGEPEPAAQVVSLAADTVIADAAEAADGIAAASAGVAAVSTCSCPTNTDMASAQTISVESYVSGCICCPGAEQWFKFVPTQSKTYTICTTGSLDTIGFLYSCCESLVASNDDFAGKVNFRIVQYLTAGKTYYIRVHAHGNQTGSYTLRVTERIFASFVSINKDTVTLQKGVLYELPITPNYTYKGYNGAQPIPGLSVSIYPLNVDNNMVWWWETSDILEVRHGWDDDGDRYIHLIASAYGTAPLRAEDWAGNGRHDECTVTVVTPYVYQLLTSCGFSSEEANLIQKVYDRVDAVFPSEHTLVKAWKCARLLSEFCYDYLTYIAGRPINKWDDVAGSVTTEEEREKYFINTLGYTQSEYNKLNSGLRRNHENATDLDLIDFTHMQNSLAARLAYTLNVDGVWSNLGTQLYTGNYGIYSDEEISYLAGWFGDAILTGIYGSGVTTLKNDDYMADLDAENIYRLIIQGCSAIDALDAYYSNMTSSNTRANIFLQNISYNTVKVKIFYELIDAKLYRLMSNASDQGNILMVKYYSDLINNEQYHYDTIKSKYPDTYDFLKSLNDRLLTMAHYQ